MSSAYPGLAYLVACYFHQDWNLDGGSAAAVLDEFRAAEESEIVCEAKEDAAELIARELPDDELMGVLEEMGMDYSPDSEGLTATDWLRLVIARLG